MVVKRKALDRQIARPDELDFGKGMIPALLKKMEEQ